MGMIYFDASWEPHKLSLFASNAGMEPHITYCCAIIYVHICITMYIDIEFKLAHVQIPLNKCILYTFP